MRNWAFPRVLSHCHRLNSDLPKVILPHVRVQCDQIAGIWFKAHHGSLRAHQSAENKGQVVYMCANVVCRSTRGNHRPHGPHQVV